MKNLNQDDIKFFNSLNIDTKSKYFRSHYRRGLLNNIDQDYINEIQKYYKEHYKQEIDPVTHIAFANLLGNKDVRVIPQLFYRRVFLSVFNDASMNDMYRDKGLYDLLINTEQKAENVLKYTRGQFIINSNEFIDEREAYKILLNDQDNEFILKPSDTNNGINIKKLKVLNDKLYIDGEEVDFNYLEKNIGYNYLIQRIIKQHEVMAKPHPQSVNTLRMATIRWKGKIHNLYTFARFGHSGNIKDNAGAGGLVVGVNEDGSFMSYGVVRSKIVYEHPTTGIKISDFGKVPNMDRINKFVRDLHKDILLQNYVAWDIAVNQNGDPVFIENNFYGSSWTNQVALNRPMFGDLTDEILQYINANESIMIHKNINSLSARRRNKVLRLEKKREKDKKKVKRLEVNLKNEQKKVETLEREIKRIKNSRSWRYTRFLRRKK